MRTPSHLAATFAAIALCSVQSVAAPTPARPRLVVLISVDQFRGDYLTRYPQLLLPAHGKEGVGGLRYLMERGAYYPNAHYTHYPLYTGPGHAVLSTGGSGASNGIIGNDWYVRGDEGTPGRVTYCVEDSESAIVGAEGARRGVSPKNLRSSTFADELKMGTGGRAKVITLSLKDRASVLLAGRLSDGTAWFDTDTGQWVSSRAYCPDGKLPAWLEEVNGKRIPDTYFGETWQLLFPDKVADNVWAPAGDKSTPSSTIGNAFPHKYTGGLDKPGRAFYADFWNSPYANEYVLKSALHGIRSLKMGQDDVPDFVGLNLASNDTVGHAFGPTSPEAFDITLRTDRYLAAFLRAIAKEVPGGLKNVVVVLTADHGVCNIPEHLASVGLHAGRVPDETVTSAIEAALDARFGADDWVASIVEPGVWLSAAACARRGADIREVRRVASDASRTVRGMYDAVTWDQLEFGQVPLLPIYRNVSGSFYPKLSADITGITENLWVAGGGTGGTTHGSPWSYDTSIPIVIAGGGVRPGRYPRPASAQEIAPTLSSLCGVQAPSACTAPPLVEVFGNGDD